MYKSILTDLLETLREQNWTRGEKAVIGLVHIGKPAVLPLIEMLGEHSYITRRLAAKALGCIGDGRAVIPLIQSLTDQNGPNRAEICKALGQMKDALATKPLIEILAHDRDPNARSYAALALGKIGDLQALKPLSEIVTSNLYFEIRLDAMNALLDIDYSRAAVPIASVLDDVNESIKLNAVIKLALIDKSILPPEILKKLDSTIKGYLLDLNNTNIKMRSSSIYVLGQIRETRAVQPLAGILLDSGSSDTVKGFAATALGNIGDAEAIKALTNALTYNSIAVKRGAAYNLGLMGSESSIDSLRVLLEDQDQSVRYEATRAISRIQSL